MILTPAIKSLQASALESHGKHFAHSMFFSLNGSCVHEVSEHYTVCIFFKNLLILLIENVNNIYLKSKCCSNCGVLDRQLGSKKTYNCKWCGMILDRDYNGAKNIWLMNYDNLCDKMMF